MKRLICVLFLGLLVGCATEEMGVKKDMPLTQSPSVAAEAKKRQDSLTVSELLKKGDYELQKKNFDEAIQSFENVLKIQPYHVAAKNALENAKKQKESVMKAAISAASKTKMTAQELAHELILVGEEKFRAGKTEEGLGYFKRATQMDPNSPHVWFALASKLHNLNKIEEAIPLYEKSISLNSQYTLVYRNLGIALIEINQLEKARQHLDYALKMNPNDPQTLRGLAMWDRISARALAKEAENFENRAIQIEQQLTPQTSK
ncbi:MAG: hypothetical protein A2174_01260 [Candidatus Portnoybacteria bacterium RBG_13_41_18]|uniref:Uncharacterized protein n=1 Tax=Candidatus Portnoybacteria bacterium RBG_13_41_18 TaxID=1801991 RepID=A0A1G2F733_9BACT|nr:MAG: hypothetical protein A2174_01260 [Candidatus Portnoybacteria bacterium RBG_13_41_18]